MSIVNKLLSALLPLKSAILHLISWRARISKMSEVLNKHFVWAFTDKKPFLCAHVLFQNDLRENPQCSHCCAPRRMCVCLHASHVLVPKDLQIKTFVIHT